MDLMSRLLALVVAVVLTGPSVGSLLCDWACATAHQPATAHGCHGDDAPTSAATVASAHLCHELAIADASILPNAPHSLIQAVTASAVDESQEDEVRPRRVPGWSHPPGISNRPPALRVPLRV